MAHPGAMSSEVWTPDHTAPHGDKGHSGGRLGPSPLSMLPVLITGCWLFGDRDGEGFLKLWNGNGLSSLGFGSSLLELAVAHPVPLSGRLQ